MCNIKVGIKLHLEDLQMKKWKVTKDNLLQSISLHPCNFKFDHIFGPECQNKEVYSSIVDPIVKMCLNGYNGTIMAYGQTSSGKSRTMIGTDNDPGIQLKAIEQIFKRDDISPFLELKIRVGYIEIYQEKIYDLLNHRKKITINPNRPCDLKLLSNIEVSAGNVKQTMDILLQGNKQRKRNEFTSKSHTIFRIMIESQDKLYETTQKSYLNFVDVAGSELVSDAHPLDIQLENANNNNKSLLCLKIVINELSEGKKEVKFSSSTLTSILHESLAGNCNTAIICNIRADVAFETISTLKFADLAKNVQCIRNDIFEGERRSGLEKELNECCKSVKTLSEESFSTASAQMKYYGTSNSSAGIEMLALEQQLKEIANIKLDNVRLMKELQDVKSILENEKKWFEDQMKSAKFDLQKSEFRQVQDQIIFTKYKNELEQRLETLNKENELLKIELNEKKAKNVNSDDNLHMEQLLSKLEVLRKNDQTNTDLIHQQKESLNRLEKENFQLKQKNHQSTAKTDILSPPGTSGTDIQNKIKRLEHTMAKNIQMLKQQFESKNVEIEPFTGGTDSITSQQISVPNSLIGRVIGIGGGTLRNMKEVTGARIKVSHINGDADRDITINGTIESVNLAMDLIKKQIEGGHNKNETRNGSSRDSYGSGISKKI